MSCRWSCLLLGALATCAAPDAGEVQVFDVPQDLAVALCQIEVTADSEANLRSIEMAIANAAEGGAQIACFPEACIFGWTNSAAHEAAATIPGETSDRIAAAARKHQMMVVIGLAERDGPYLYNTAVLIDTDGSLLAKHRKMNILSELMDPPYQPGESAQGSVVDTRYGRIGMLICADTFQDETVAQLAAQQPDLVIVPYGWAAPAGDWPQHADSLHAWISHTARRCRAPVVGVDSTGELHSGPWKGFILGGQSMACDAKGNPLEILPDRAPSTRIVSLPKQVRTE
jgi:N-carbamoylputrescine amidase